MRPKTRALQEGSDPPAIATLARITSTLYVGPAPRPPRAAVLFHREVAELLRVRAPKKRSTSCNMSTSAKGAGVGRLVAVVDGAQQRLDDRADEAEHQAEASSTSRKREGGTPALSAQLTAVIRNRPRARRTSRTRGSRSSHAEHELQPGGHEKENQRRGRRRR